MEILFAKPEHDPNIFFGPVNLHGFSLKLSHKDVLIQILNNRGFWFYMKLGIISAELLEFMPENHRKNRLIVLQAIKNHKNHTGYIPESLRKDKIFMKEIIKLDVSAIRDCDPILLNDKEFILDILTIKDAHYLNSHFEKSLFDDRDFVQRAIKIAPEIYIPTFRQDREIILEQLRLGESYLTPDWNYFSTDKEIIIEYVKNVPFPFIGPIDSDLKRNKEFIESILKLNGKIFRDIDDSLKTDRQLALLAATHNGESLEFLLDHHKKDKEIVLVALNQNVEAIEFVDESLLDDADVVNVLNKHVKNLNNAL
jgi:hypothetical protein